MITTQDHHKGLARYVLNEPFMESSRSDHLQGMFTNQSIIFGYNKVVFGYNAVKGKPEI